MVDIVKELSVEHVLMFVIVAFLLYHLIGGCSCGMRSRDGFSVGVDKYIVKCPTKSGTQSPQCPLQDKECPSENYSAWVDKNSSCTCPLGQEFAYDTAKPVKRCDHNAGVQPICKAKAKCPGHIFMPHGMAYDCADIKQTEGCDNWVDTHGFQCKDNVYKSRCTINMDKPRCE